MYKNKKGGIVGIIITIIILIIIVSLTNVEINKVSKVENIFSAVVMPIQNSLVYLKNKIKGNDSFFQNIDKLKAENEELKQKNSELEQKLREFEIVKSENETLKEYVNLKEKYNNYESIPSYVINKEISNFGSTIIINVGKKDGVEPNMTVISDKGLVGYIISTTNTTAKVQTIIDTATEQKLREFEIVKSENETLKEYVNLKEKYNNYESIPSYVINKEISNFGSTIIINVGKKDGVEPNMTVISDKGLVGYIISTTNTTAKVQTIIDTATAVSATISTSRDSILVRGTLDANYTLKATYIPTDAKLLQGDIIETSGIGGIYPKGIKIGTIKEIINTKNITDRYAIIETAVDFSKLETVLVIK